MSLHELEMKLTAIEQVVLELRKELAQTRATREANPVPKRVYTAVPAAEPRKGRVLQYGDDIREAFKNGKTEGREELEKQLIVFLEKLAFRSQVSQEDWNQLGVLKDFLLDAFKVTVTNPTRVMDLLPCSCTDEMKDGSTFGKCQVCVIRQNIQGADDWLRRMTDKGVVDFRKDFFEMHWKATQWQKAVSEKEAEKKRRVRYQDIVYAVCNWIDARQGKDAGAGVLASCPTILEAMDQIATSPAPQKEATALVCLNCGKALVQDVMTGELHCAGGCAGLSVQTEGFKRLQAEQSEWWLRNFGPQEKDSDLLQFLGVVEEVGEMAHAILKQRQGIRGTADANEAKLIDAVGDLTVFLASFCSMRQLDWGSIVWKVWEEVRKRDWTQERAENGKLPTSSQEAPSRIQEWTPVED